jgi:hypothetical protein
MGTGLLFVLSQYLSAGTRYTLDQDRIEPVIELMKTLLASLFDSWGFTFALTFEDFGIVVAVENGNVSHEILI